LDIEDNPPLGILKGCGVTAPSKEYAIDIIKKKVFKNSELPEIIEFVENIDIRTLDENHVRPNMGNPVVPGIWFPLGYI
jgi:hypothetical protein